MQRLRVRLLDAILRAVAANKEALDLALQIASGGDAAESEHPPNVVKEADKTGPRTPFKTDTPPPGTLRPLSRRPTAYAHVAITEEQILEHLRTAHKEATSDSGRADVLRTMRGLVDQGVIKETDVSDLLPVLKR
jgi:hypothetical protein